MFIFAEFVIIGSIYIEKGVFMLKGKTVLLGVTGSIAAYKMANVANMLVKMGCDVHVILT